MKLFSLIISLTGVFFFPMKNMTDIPQAAYFIFSAGLVFSSLLVRKNILAGAMLAWVSGIFLFTTLYKGFPMIEALDGILTSLCVAVIYYATRELRLREDCLKWFLIPAIINIIFIFTQVVFPRFLPLQSQEVCGLLGNAGLTATFLGMTTPIFLKYFKVGLPFLFLAIVVCNGFVGTAAFMACLLLGNKWHRKEILIFVSLLVLAALAVCILSDFGPFLLRLSMWAGTLDGILCHPFLGWGLGSFVDVVSKIPMADSYYFGVPFNTLDHVMNHPANEFLFGGWNFGLPFVILMILLTVATFKNLTNSISSGVLLAGFVVMMGFMFTPPTLFLMAIAYGIFENQQGDENGRQA